MSSSKHLHLNHLNAANARRRRMKASVSTLTLICAAGASGLAHAQTVINDGDNVTVTSQANGETITAAAGVTSEVNGAPVVIFNNDDVTLNNAGTLRTLGVTNTVQINENADNGVVNNLSTGVLEAASRAVDIQGDGFTLNNEGIIRGVGDQRNGTVYANRTANDFAINNIGGASVIDAGSGNNGAGVSIELGGGGAPITGSISNEGLIQGRGQAAAPDNTAGDGVRFFGPGLAPSYTFVGDITNSGDIVSESAVGPVAGVRFSNAINFQGVLDNQADGVISGVNNGVYFGDADHTGGVVNNAGTISSGSRAFNIDGVGLEINNTGSILGTGNQRNGTVYADSTAQGFTLNNLAGGTIDAGAGLEGAGFSVELSESGNAFGIVNAGDIFGRGDAGAGLATAGDGIRLERTRVGGALDGTTTGLFTGTITNSGNITSEGANGTVGGFRAVNGVSFQGTLTNEAGGVISGVQNGVYFGNPTPAGGGDHTGGVVNNAGTISSGSRAFNIDGIGLEINNSGSILGTGNQRNGTVYADSTAQGFTLNNLVGGTIDAGAGLEGAGFSVELSESGNNFDIVNAGDILGRGNAGAGIATAGDGIRLERARVGGALDGTTTGLFTGTITNAGNITSEGANGTVGGFRAVNGVSFQGTLTNEAGGVISGVQNGVYFGNPTPAGGGDHTGGVVNNFGTISSASRAFNIDGVGLEINNSGSILGTGNQRNGTVYADSTAQGFTLNNLAGGVIDAGAGLEGAGFSVELSDSGNAFDIVNAGDILGRGDAGAGLATAGDGLRFERARVDGALDGTTTGLFTGTITNTGNITSEGANGTVGGVRFVNGVSFQGVFDNSGVISGVQNGLYFGNPTPAGGGDHTGGVVNNLAGGVISSGSRALNIDGLGLVVNNAGSILGTGDQRNGTVYSDGTANNFTFNNLAGGLVDAGAGNNGSGVSLQLGASNGDARTISVSNAGTIAGRGDALASGAAAGLRLFSSVDNVSVDGDVVNSGDITSETAAAILIENVDFTGALTNSGALTGAASFDASAALGGVAFTQAGGSLNGDFIGSSFADTLSFASGSSVLAGDILGGVDTTVAAGATAAVSGDRALDGDLTSNGTLAFELGADSLSVDGDVTLGAGSAVAIATPDDISGFGAGAPIAVLSETGAFTDNGAVVTVEDDDFLLDYAVALGSVTVTPTAVDLAAVSGDANVSAFGGALTDAFTAGQLDAGVANALNDSANLAAFESGALSLLPSINEGVTREIYETQSLANAAVERRLNGEGTGLWGQFLYRNADRDADSLSIAGYDAESYGFTVGADRRLSETVVAGLSFSYANIDIDNDGVSREAADIDSYAVSGYAGYEQGRVFANGVVGYSFNDVEANRASAVGSIGGAYDVDGFNVQANLGYDLIDGPARFAPIAGIQYANLSQDSFTETGGLGLAVDAEDVSFLDLKVGFEASNTISANGWSMRPLVRAAYVYDAIGDERVLNASFAGAAAPFTLRTAEPAQSRAEFGAGLELSNAQGVALSLEYDGEAASNYTAHGGFLRARFNF